MIPGNPKKHNQLELKKKSGEMICVPAEVVKNIKVVMVPGHQFN
jgi:hypothetical protein